MGKLGARELNFSSDIDLILFFDPDAPAITDPLDGTELFSRLARRLVRILQDRTGDGYVFRTDLRLRPDPGSTPLAIPVGAALSYYEGRGQNWERAAMSYIELDQYILPRTRSQSHRPQRPRASARSMR